MASERNKYLFKNTAIFVIGNFATKLISFFLVPLYTNALTTEQYGAADLVTTVCTVLGPVLILNISEGVMRFALDKDADHAKIMSVGLVTLALAIVVGLAVIPVTGMVSQLTDYVLYVYFYMVTLAGSQLFFCYLRGRERLVAYAVGNIVQTLSIALLNILFLLVLDLGLPGYFSAYILASTIAIVYGFFAGDVIDVVRNFKFDGKLAKEMIKYSIVLVPNTFMWWIMNSSDRILVTALLGSAANGIYAVSYKIPSAVSMISGIFNQAWGYSAIREESSADREEYANRVYRSLAGMSVIVGVGLLLIMKPLMSVYVEASYYEAWRYTPWLVIGNVFMTTGTFLSSWYTVNKDSRGFLFSATCGAVVNVALNLALIPLLGITGSALATCASYIAVFLYRVFDTRRYIHIKVIDARQGAGYVALFLAGFSMFADGILGEVLLLAELLMVMWLFRDVWVPILKVFVRKARARLSLKND